MALGWLLNLGFAGGGVAAYYVRKDGTASKVNAVGPTSDASACMSRTTFNASSFDAGDTVYFSDKGGDYLRTITLPSSNVTYAAAPGESPRIRSSLLIASGSSWSLNGSVYSISAWIPHSSCGCWVDGTTVLPRMANANLSPGEFYADSAGDVMHIRLADDSDPGDHDIYFSRNETSISVTGKTNVVIDGLTIRHGAQQATQKGMWISGCTNFTIRNCVVEYLVTYGIRFYQFSGTVMVENCTFRYIWNGKAYGSDGEGNPLYWTSPTAPTGVTIQDNTFTDCYVGLTMGGVSAPVTMQNNIIKHCHVNCCEITGTAANKHTFVHNTIIHKVNPDVIPDNGHGLVLRTGVGAIVKSNLFYYIENGVSGAELIQIDADSYDYLDIDYNVYHAEGSPDHTFHYAGGQSNDLADWQTWFDGTGYLGGDDNSFIANPCFDDDYAPRNAALHDAGHDGETIGAVEYAPAGVTLQIAMHHYQQMAGVN